MNTSEKKILNTKKSILDQIEVVKNDEKQGMNEAELIVLYNEIDDAIEAMRPIVKTNTIMFLKNQLKNNLGKYEPLEKQLEVDYFIEFFKQAYPPGKRRKEFTWVVTDKNRITIDQILETLKFINAYSMKKKLTKEEKLAILPMIERIAYTDSMVHINQLRSLEQLRKVLRFKIVTRPEGHFVVRI